MEYSPTVYPIRPEVGTKLFDVEVVPWAFSEDVSEPTAAFEVHLTSHRGHQLALKGLFCVLSYYLLKKTPFFD
jgi:hypothetical protein